MIAIERSLPAPAVLTKHGAKRAATHCNRYAKDEAAHCSGAKTFTLDNKIYAHPTVKAALIAMQHKKCCYCERIIGESGDIEHFRPKGTVRQSETDPAQTPGYYWLAYDWDNLLYTCKECNQTHKRDLFPLADAGKRVRSHTDAANLPNENPLLLNPAQTDPIAFIGFREEYAYAIGGNAVAKETIRVCGLNRSDLAGRRREHLDNLRDYLVILMQDDDLKRTWEGRYILATIRQKLAEVSSVGGEFSAMVREVFLEPNHGAFPDAV